MVTDFEEYSRPVVVYRDSGSGDVAENFILSLCEEYERLEPLLQMEEEMNLTEAEEGTHFAASRCYLCHEPLDNKSKTRDHCHYTGRYLGAAHKGCNLERKKDSKRIPIVFHNFKGYDVHC